ncbi:putative membrane protein, partial [Chlamydia psittaci 06-1683]
MFFFILTT